MAVLLGVGVLFLVGGLSTAMLFVIGRLAGTPVAELPLWVALMSTAVLQAGMLATALVFGPLRRGSPGLLLGHRRLPTWQLFAWAALAFLGSIAVSAAYVFIAERISPDLLPEPLPGGIDFTEAWLLAFVIVVLFAPFAEEVFFRGFLFAGLAGRYGFWAAALVSAVVFAVVHFELARTVPAMLSGVVFAAVYWRSGSVWPSVLAHTAQNAIAFGLAP